ncbi:DUF5690 family protein [Puia dinghuensis]|uniref:MFS transporter n=1 Tax=Puia dinghuensis TaxID=1792502 RepID=A0A8J2UEN6_9BACT|nr:DUF5690 family protein [Puia dinghuensis]GGB07424.1 hypothetical protein GCM10011511_33640 [Puia dinghuensis]
MSSPATPPTIPAAALTAGGRLTLKARLQRSPAWVLILYASVTGYIVYASMYGIRKPFTAASYDGITFLGISYKVVLVIAQVIGYTLSKFFGIRFIGGMRPERRAWFIILLIGTGWLSLLLFAIVPVPYNFVFMFINGLPLGMVWGLMFGFLEGRKVTELMGAIVATSFIFASGLAKTVGKSLLLHGVSESWMPFLAGAVFIGPALISTWLLNQTPPPSAEDIAQRTVRLPMDREQRRNFLRIFGFALIPVIIAYVMLTILRDFTEDFANELWTETGFRNNADVFATSSTIVSLLVLAVIGGFFVIRNNYRAFQLNNVIIIGGFVLAAGSTIAFHLHVISPMIWIVSASAGLYLGYVPYNCFYFERMLAAYRIPGNVGFIMYIADAFGYLGTVVVLLVKEFVHLRYSWVDFFTGMFYVSAFAGILLILWGSVLFTKIYSKIN